MSVARARLLSARNAFAGPATITRPAKSPAFALRAVSSSQPQTPPAARQMKGTDWRTFATIGGAALVLGGVFYAVTGKPERAAGKVAGMGELANKELNKPPGARGIDSHRSD